MNKKAIFTAIASSTLALTLTLGTVKATENHNETITTQTQTQVNNHTDITQVSSSSAKKVSGKFHTTDSLNLRSDASTSSKIKTSVSKGTVVKVSYKKTVNGRIWYKVTIKGKTGWMSGAYLKKGGVTKTSSDNESTSDIVRTALKYLGTPYRYGGTTAAGFDCSGFTRYVYAQNGISLDRTSRTQRAQIKYTTNPKAGDLVFFNVGGSAITHVAIYMGNHKVVHAAGDHVQVQSMSGYWDRYVHSYGTVR